MKRRRGGERMITRASKTWFWRKPEAIQAMTLPLYVHPESRQDARAFLVAKILSGDKRGIKALLRMFLRDSRRHEVLSLDMPLGESDGDFTLKDVLDDKGTRHRTSAENRRARTGRERAIYKCKQCGCAFSAWRFKAKSRRTRERIFCGATCQQNWYRAIRTKVPPVDVLRNDVNILRLTTADIARKYGCSHAAIVNYMKREGILRQQPAIRMCHCGKPALSLAAKYCGFHRRLARAKTYREHGRRYNNIPPERWKIIEVAE